MHVATFYSRILKMKKKSQKKWEKHSVEKCWWCHWDHAVDDNYNAKYLKRVSVGGDENKFHGAELLTSFTDDAL